MFKKIIFHVEKRELLFFWDKNFNLFKKFSESQLNEIERILKKLLIKLEKNIDENNTSYIVELICKYNNDWMVGPFFSFG